MARPVRKRGNADYKVSSYYITRRTDTAFKHALLDVQDQGFQIDRSDIIEGLIAEWVENPRPIARRSVV